MTRDEGKKLIGQPVRIRPRGGMPHWGRGILIRARRNHGVVRPQGDVRETKVPWGDLRPWKSLINANGRADLTAVSRRDTCAAETTMTTAIAEPPARVRTAPTRPDSYDEILSRPERLVIFNQETDEFWNGTRWTTFIEDSKLWNPEEDHAAKSKLAELRSKMQTNLSNAVVCTIGIAFDIVTSPRDARTDFQTWAGRQEAGGKADDTPVESDEEAAAREAAEERAAIQEVDRDAKTATVLAKPFLPPPPAPVATVPTSPLPVSHRPYVRATNGSTVIDSTTSSTVTTSSWATVEGDGLPLADVVDEEPEATEDPEKEYDFDSIEGLAAAMRAAQSALDEAQKELSRRASRMDDIRQRLLAKRKQIDDLLGAGS